MEMWGIWISETLQVDARSSVGEFLDGREGDAWRCGESGRDLGGRGRDSVERMQD